MEHIHQELFDNNLTTLHNLFKFGEEWEKDLADPNKRYTILAPTNETFTNQLGQPLLDRLLAADPATDPEAVTILDGILKNHVVDGSTSDEILGRAGELKFEDILTKFRLLSEKLLESALAHTVLSAGEVAKYGLVTLLDESHPVRLERKTMFLGEGKVIQIDLLAKNGVIHTIDKVLVPV